MSVRKKMSHLHSILRVIMWQVWITWLATEKKLIIIMDHLAIRNTTSRYW